MGARVTADVIYADLAEALRVSGDRRVQVLVTRHATEEARLAQEPIILDVVVRRGRDILERHGSDRKFHTNVLYRNKEAYDVFRAASGRKPNARAEPAEFAGLSRERLIELVLEERAGREAAEAQARDARLRTEVEALELFREQLLAA